MLRDLLIFFIKNSF